MKLPDTLKAIVSDLHKEGIPAYVVGGAVRDHVFGIEPNDFDIATPASKEQVYNALSGWQRDIHGKAFGVVAVKHEKEVYEIATFREDISEGRRPVVRFGVTLEEDAMRRDFTINALYYQISTGKILDPTGGLADIEAQRLRMPGKAEDRLREDRLRLLRAFRFAARFGLAFDYEIHAAVRDNNSLYYESGERVSQPRITVEWKSGIEQAVDPLGYVRSLMDYGMMPAMFPGMPWKGSATINSRRAAMVLSDLLSGAEYGEFVRIATSLVDLKFSREDAIGVRFLLGFKRLRSHPEIRLAKRMEASTDLRREDLLQWGNHIGDPQLADAYLRYEELAFEDAQNIDPRITSSAEGGRLYNNMNQERFLSLLKCS
jgi:tRNA nucleotidyltransferase/poly(A) polymerase